MRLLYLLAVIPKAIPVIQSRIQNPDKAANVNQFVDSGGSCMNFMCPDCPIGRQVCASIYAAERHIIMKAVMRKGD